MGMEGVIEREERDDRNDSDHLRWGRRRLRAMKFEDSHPFAKNANGWGTERLWHGEFVVSHPFAKNANGWGTERLWDWLSTAIELRRGLSARGCDWEIC